MFYFNKLTAILLLAMMLLGIANPSSAQAGGLDEDMSGETFSASTAVDDAELSEMRGGFISVNGLLIGFSFQSNVQVGIETIQNLNINTEMLTQAALDANQLQQLQQLLDPLVIQNIENDVLIAIQQSLSIDILNAAQLNQQSQMEQLNVMQGMN